MSGGYDQFFKAARKNREAEFKPIARKKNSVPLKVLVNRCSRKLEVFRCTKGCKTDVPRFRNGLAKVDFDSQ